jgi:DNA replication factor GINS
LDEFFQKLREIQKKERTNSGLARVGDDFYHRVHRYLEELMDTVGNDPFAKEQYLLRDTQRIATEICERREHKITDSAVMNIQRSYHLFKGKPQFDLQDTNPLNLTPEEEQLYFSLIDILKGYRDKIIPSLDVLDEVPPKIQGSDIDGSSAPELSKVQESVTPEKSLDAKSGSGENLKSTGIINKKIPEKNSKIGDELSIVNPLNNDSERYEEYDDLKILDDQNNIQIQDDQSITAAGLKSSDDSKNKLKSNKINFNTLVIFDEIPSIVGVDEKVYGPFCPQDVVILPEVNAQIFIKSRKGRLIRS